MAVQIIGEKVEVPKGRVLITRPDGSYHFPVKVDSLKTRTKINPEDYALVQQGDVANGVITLKQGVNNHNYNDTHIKRLKRGLAVPTAAIFMPHYKNANLALNEQGVLYDASGNLIQGERLQNSVHALNYDCWAWLNGSFLKGEGFLDLDLATITGLDSQGRLQISKQPLEDCLENDGRASLDCDGDPDYVNPRLGSFAYAEGVAPEKTGDKE